ncbi:hypothetical protein A8709_20755 [Paenibacillus pectinilyticus]|uniref:DUF1700 domain-containing protein n=1 Tax=Paenibacillus pectinilyticus TaxID=512399 RepID=A0A1C0ZYJ5_9BACL|nr:DUF1700 domain-containing protein [Paenibacillus pectinilyticus]OCT13176.1 hypothetical protein A8709_20755 [Paenibacillus pectinilyticus]
MSKADYFNELNYRLRGLPEKERQNILKVYEELFQKAVENGKHEDEVALSLGYPRVPNWDAQKETPSAPPVPPAPPVQEKAFKSTPNLMKEDSKPPTGAASDLHVDTEEEVPVNTYVKQPEPSMGPKIPAPAPDAWEPPTYTQAPNPNYPPVYNAPYPNPYPTKPDTGIKAIIISIMLGFFNLLFVLGPWLGICAALIGFFVAGFALLIAPVIGVLTSLAGTTGSDFQFISFSLLACFGLGIIITTLSSWLLKMFFKLSRAYIQFNAKLIKGV